MHRDVSRKSTWFYMEASATGGPISASRQSPCPPFVSRPAQNRHREAQDMIAVRNTCKRTMHSGHGFSLDARRRLNGGHYPLMGRRVCDTLGKEDPTRPLDSSTERQTCGPRPEFAWNGGTDVGDTNFTKNSSLTAPVCRASDWQGHHNELPESLNVNFDIERNDPDERQSGYESGQNRKVDPRIGTQSNALPVPNLRERRSQAPAGRTAGHADRRSSPPQAALGRYIKAAQRGSGTVRR